MERLRVVGLNGFADELQAALAANTPEQAPLNLRHLAEEIHVEGEPRCAICFWPLADSSDRGCVRGNCSMRGEAGEYERNGHRAHVEAIVKVLQKALPQCALAQPAAGKREG